MRYLSNGFGGLLGPKFVTRKPVNTKSRVWYVHHEQGTDSSDPVTKGMSRESPFASVTGTNGALSHAEAWDVIVMMDGHYEDLAGDWSLPIGCQLVGEGRVDGLPSVRLQNNDERIIQMDTFSAIRNVRWLPPEPGVMVSEPTIVTEESHIALEEVYVELTGDNKVPFMVGDIMFVTFKNVTFRSLADSYADAPAPAVLQGTDDPDGEAFIQAHGLVFDGLFTGSIAFRSNPRLGYYSMWDVSLLRGACMLIGAGEEVGGNAAWHHTRGHIHIAKSTGGARLEWQGAATPYPAWSMSTGGGNGEIT